MAATNTVERVEIIGSSRGLDQLADDLDRVAIAQDNVADATKATENVSERSSRSVIVLQKSLEKQARTLDSAYKSQQDYARNLTLLNRGLDQGAISASTHAQRLELLNQRYGMLAAANDNVAVSMSRFERASGLMAVGINKATLALTAATTAALAGAAAFGSVVSTATEFQKLGASLRTVTGSSENAERAFAFIRQFAAETPYTLQEVTQAFIRLQALGLDPSRKALEAYGNVASAMGTPMLQFVEAVADAMTGEFERLKEFGIRAAQDGDKVSLTFQGVTKTIGKNAKEIEAYLQDIGRNQFGGAMAEQMKILPGIFGNAADAVDNFKNAIGEGGLTGAVAVAVSNFTEFLNKNQDLAASIGAVAGGAIELYTRAFGALVDGLVEASRWVQATAKVMGEIVSAFTAGSETVSTFGAGMSSMASGMLAAIGAIVNGWQAAGQAIYSTLNAIIGAGVGAYQAVKAAWDQLPAAFGLLAKEAGNALVTGLEVAVNGALAGVNTIVAGINRIAPEFAQIPEIPAVDLSAYKASLTDAQVVTKETIGTILSTAQATDYLGAGVDALAEPFAAIGARIGDAKRGLDEAAEAANRVAPAAKLTGEGFQIAAAGADAAGTATAEAGKKAEKAGESYAKLGASLDSTVADLERQISTLGQSEGAIAAAEFKARELAKAWEIARAAGTNLIPPETLAAIDAASAKVGGLTSKLGALNEANAAVDEFFPFEKASREAERLQGVLADTSLGLTDIQRQALGLKIEKGFTDAASAASGLRGGVREIGDEFGRVGDIAEDAFGGLIDALTRGGNLMENLLGFAADLGSQLASIGAKKLFGDLFGGGQSGGSARGGGVVNAISSAIGGGGIPIPTSRPVVQSPSYPYADKYALPNPTPAMRTQSAALAQGVTQAVSRNLLSSILGAGKSGSHISGLNAQFATALTSMLEAAPAAVQSAVTINSGFRSVARQAELFDAALKKYGSVAAARKWVAPPGNSMHNKGMAADLGYGSSTAREWIHANAGKYGLAFPLGHENWHIELAGGRGGARSATAAYTDQRIVQRGVSEGLKDYNRQFSGTPSRQAQAAMANGSFDGFAHSGGRSGLFSQNGLSVLGAGIGAFGAGYQSGSPFSGGLSGALGGYQAGPAISSMLGVGGMAGSVLGVVGGAALGILGGILGARKQRQEAHKQAAAQWAQVQPQYEAFKKSLSGEETGNLRGFMSERWNQLRGYIDVGSKAWKMGSGNSSAEFSDTFIKISEAWHREIDKFREGFAPALESLASGLGIDNAFSKGRDAAAQLKTKVQQFVDDVKVAYGEAWMGTGDVVDPRYSAEYDSIEERTRAEREENVRKAQVAAKEYALSMLYTEATTSDVADALAGLRGTASGLVATLIELGDTAATAASDIGDRLTKAIANVKKTFVEGLQASINDLSGVGYFNDVADLLKSRDVALSDAALLGVDPSLVTDWFKLAAQDIVNGSQLTGSAFDALIAKFPELAGIVKSFSEAVTVTTAEVEENYRTFLDSRLSELTSARAEAENKLTSAFQRTVDWVKSLVDFVADMNLSDTSPLGGREKTDLARQTFLDLAAKAASGDVEAQEKLLGSSQDLLDASREYYVSSEAYFADFKLVQDTLKATEVKTTSQLDQMRSQVSFLSAIDTNTKSLATLMGEWIEADKAQKALQKQIDGNRTFGLNPERNRLIDAGVRQLGLNYTGNYGLQADGSDPFRTWRESLPAAQLAAVIGVIQQYIGINRASGGPVYGPGTSTSDSIMANLSNGEFVTNAWATRQIGMPAMQYMNRTGRLPDAYPARTSSVVAVGNDNRGVEQRLDRLEALLRLQVQTTGQGLRENTAAVQNGNRSSEQMALASRRQSAKAA